MRKPKNQSLYDEVKNGMKAQEGESIADMGQRIEKEYESRYARYFGGEAWTTGGSHAGTATQEQLEKREAFRNRVKARIKQDYTKF